MPEIIIIVIIGLVAGVLSGMFGIGGGAIIVPALAVFLGYELQLALGTSLGALLLPVGIFAAWSYYEAGLLRIGVAAPVALGLLVSTFFGAQLALNLPTDILRFIYGVFLLYNSWKFVEPRKLWAERHQTAAAAGPDLDDARIDVPRWQLLVVGLVAGVMSGLFGIGGGVVIVPALVSLLRMDQKLAVGTSLGALLLPVGIGGVIGYYQEGQIDLLASTIIAVGLLIGAFAGARIALGLPSKTVKRLYGVFLFFVGLRFVGLFAWLGGLFSGPR